MLNETFSGATSSTYFLHDLCDALRFQDQIFLMGIAWGAILSHFQLTSDNGIFFILACLVKKVLWFAFTAPVLSIEWVRKNFIWVEYPIWVKQLFDGSHYLYLSNQILPFRRSSWKQPLRTQKINQQNRSCKTYSFRRFTVINLVSFHQSQAMFSTDTPAVLRCPFIDIGFNLF